MIIDYRQTECILIIISFSCKKNNCNQVNLRTNSQSWFEPET